MDKNSKVVIIGAGVFGLSTARQLALDGYRNIVVLDRHVPPVPDGSSSDISRVVRFDYADGDYLNLAHEAYLQWRNDPKYKGIFFPCSYIIAGTRDGQDGSWMDKTTTQLTKFNLPWTLLDDPEAARRVYPILTGTLAPRFAGYHHNQAGWADASKGISLLRDECLGLGVSLICGPAGTVIGLQTDSQNRILAVRTLGGQEDTVSGDHFILAAGAWTSGLVPMYNSTLATGQVLGYLPLTDEELVKYKDLPIYSNYSSGWFNFPPHEEKKTLKMAVHGWGYTRAPGDEDRKLTPNPSSPPLKSRERPNFAPSDGEDRLREGLREILPELADRPFEKVAMCWYTDTPSGDFIMDYHPDYKNLFIGGAGSGHAFKFLPVLGKYMSLAISKKLPSSLASKWRFRKDYQNRADAFVGDGSRGGPARRELTTHERAKLDSVKAKL